MSAPSSMTFTRIRPERLLAQIGKNTRLLTASNASKAITTQHAKVEFLVASSNRQNAGGSEISHECSYFANFPTTHTTHNTHNTHSKHNTYNLHDTRDMHDAHDTKDVRFTDKINKAK